MAAMRDFLRDYESGKAAGRYVEHALPDPVALPDQSYGLGLGSHSLLLYENPGYEFHIAAIAAMLRLCREVRSFPICNLDGEATALARDVAGYFARMHTAAPVATDHRFQKSTHEMMVITS
ncbi:hypothetical protein SDC9_127628 [bioreactor metagenome]|uniref:Uncharacterized protein n=1 Tax=bioreactor metagenome TaxID=1076179 RepID=A0A645CUL0_9ZZZZ